MLNIGLKLFKKNHLKSKNQVLYYSFKSNGLKEIENLINNFLNVRNSFIFESVEKGFIKADILFLVKILIKYGNLIIITAF